MKKLFAFFVLAAAGTVTVTAQHIVQSASPEIGKPAAEVAQPTETGTAVRQHTAAAIGQPVIAQPETQVAPEPQGEALRRDADARVEE